MSGFLVLLSSLAVIVGFASTVVSLYHSIHVRREIQQVAVNVNGNIHALVSRIAQLTEIMTRHGVPVPPPPIPLPEAEETK